MKDCDNPACNRRVRNEIGYCCGTCADCSIKAHNGYHPYRNMAIHDEHCYGRIPKDDWTDGNINFEEFALQYCDIEDIYVDINKSKGTLIIRYKFIPGEPWKNTTS